MIGNVAVSQLFKKGRFKRAYSSCLPKFCRKWFPVTCTSNLESLSSWRNLRLWYVESALLVLANERLVQKQLYTRNKVLNRFEALCGKSSLSTAFDTDSKLKKYFRALTFYQATWLACKESWFKWVTTLLWNLQTSSSIRSSPDYINEDRSYQRIFTLPTPPILRNCHFNYFLAHLHTFRPRLGKSPSALPITNGLLFGACFEPWYIFQCAANWSNSTF